MKILQICNKVPFPPKDGGCIAMNNLTNGLLEQGHSVKVLAINTPKHYTKISTLPEKYRAMTNIEAVFIDTSVRPIPALLNLFSKDSYNISRFYSREMENKIIELLKAEPFDIIQLESLFVSMYVSAIRKYSEAKIILRAHNVEHQIWERNAESSGNFLKKKYFSFLAGRLKTYETESLLGFDGIAAITQEDAAWFVNNGFKKMVQVIPFGIDMEKINTEKEVAEETMSVFHLGAMDWQPNVQGIHWFLENVWNTVHQRHPDLKIYLAGRKMTEELKKINEKNIVVLGEVENAHEFIRSKGLMVVPLLSGGGMRVKLIEGMALGKVIVTTSVGAEGIACEHNKNILIADDAVAFADAISSYISGKDHLKEIGKNAKLLVAEHYNNADISKKLTSFYNSLI